MPLYSVNRRRAIILLVLTSVLLITLDVRGNAVVNRVRNAFSHVLSPFVTAGDVIATPIKNAWHGATDYQDLKRDNEQLRRQVEQQRGDQLAARAFVSAYQELLTLNGLIANYPRVTARVVGPRTSNFRQTIEIDRGTNDGILVGMAVISAAGLVGKITQVYDNRSVVLLVTDPEYVIDCKVSGAEMPVVGGGADGDATQETTASGINVSDLTSTTTTSTTIAPSTENTVLDGQTTSTASPPAINAAADGTASATSTTESATTTTVAIVERETGGCEGRGPNSLPAMKFVTEDPLYGVIEEGDVIATTGGSDSLAPPDIIIGTVINKIERASSSGPLLEIDLSADLDHLNLVQIVKYRPTSEVPG
ncbi:MAG: rod shape-determining protein MreC [Ilumatobacteraceae bacterium]